MHKRVALKRILKFTLKQHHSRALPSFSGRNIYKTMAGKQRSNILQKIRRWHFDHLWPKQNRWKDNYEPYVWHRQAFGIQLSEEEKIP